MYCFELFEDVDGEVPDDDDVDELFDDVDDDFNELFEVVEPSELVCAGRFDRESIMVPSFWHSPG